MPEEQKKIVKLQVNLLHINYTYSTQSSVQLWMTQQRILSIVRNVASFLSVNETEK